VRWNEPAPDERDAQERAWKIVRAAWTERDPVAHPRTIRRAPLVAFAAVLAVAAAVLSPPGMAVLGSIKDAVRGEPNAKPALFSLPAPGQLLVTSARGTWVVQHDGTKRLLRGYRNPAWSPNGIYIAAVHGHELRAIEPTGAEHWSLARSAAIRFPVWTDASPPCCRIAYLAGSTLRVVNGDSTGDRMLATAVAPVRPAWRPQTHALAFVDESGAVRIVDADAGKPLRIVRPEERALGLGWSADGRYLLVRGARRIELFGSKGQRLQPLGQGAAPVDAATFSPSGSSIAFVQHVPTRDGTRSFLWRYAGIRPDRTAAGRVFAGAGRFGGVEWSPDGRWLLLDWDSADQWLFIRSAAVRRVAAISNVTASFGPDATIAGWCCP
jgi:hypothetical protein